MHEADGKFYPTFAAYVHEINGSPHINDISTAHWASIDTLIIQLIAAWSTFFCKSVNCAEIELHKLSIPQSVNKS